MQILLERQYFGDHYYQRAYSGLYLSDTAYTHEWVDWHYHENVYFTFLLQGRLFEANKKEEYLIRPGDLLFHNWQDPHYNRKPPEYGRGFHLEIDSSWLQRHQINLHHLEGSFQVQHPYVKSLMTRLYADAAINDGFTKLSIEMLLLDMLGSLQREQSNGYNNAPTWVMHLRDALYEKEPLKLTALALSEQVGVHPVHLSRTFHRYFGTSFATFMRSRHLSSAIQEILDSSKSIGEIALQNGFYDASHLNTVFRQYLRTTPLALRNKVKGG